MKSISVKLTALGAVLTVALAIGFVCAPIAIDGSSKLAKADKPDPTPPAPTLGGILIPPPDRHLPQNPHPPITGR